MITLFSNISSLIRITNNQSHYKIQSDMQNICEEANTAMICDENMQWIGSQKEINQFINDKNLNAPFSISIKNKTFQIDKVYDCSGKTIMPGFVDPHTHLVFAGSRANEFIRRLQGATYIDIAKEGGGILSTVNATRKASEDELYNNAKKLIINAIKYGTVAFEIKSGYGLDLETELKMLRVIKKLKNDLPIHISATFLGAHDFPEEYRNNHDKYVDIICNEMLPRVAEEQLAEYCDAFVDDGYYTIHQAERIFNKAMELGLKIKMHADELVQFGGAEFATQINAVSADHLIMISEMGIQSLAKSQTVATVLPGTSFSLRAPYAPARKLIDGGAITALATDCNPGSSFNENMQMILWLATINSKMSAEEALVASTLNSAYAIEQSSTLGSIELGKEASFIMLDTPSYKDLFYHYGVNHIEKVFVKGIEFID